MGSALCLPAAVPEVIFRASAGETDCILSSKAGTWLPKGTTKTTWSANPILDDVSAYVVVFFPSFSLGQLLLK